MSDLSKPETRDPEPAFALRLRPESAPCLSVPILLALALIPLMLNCAADTNKRQPQKIAMPTGFVNKTMTIDGAERRYVVYVPPHYKLRKEWPLILFLHGAGERGDDGVVQTQVGIGRAIRRWPERFPCIVVMPQCPKDTRWEAVQSHIDLALQQTLSEYNIDPTRIYLTGLSMGGSGTWSLGAQKPDYFAALMPLCGRGGAADATRLTKIPIWVFHGAKDPVVNVDESRRMVEAVKKAGGNIQYTEYPDEDHNCWDVTYGNKDVIAWLLKQKKER